ncbi:hypothetical protein C2F74_RS18905 [Vibrio parahaemolyticus]|nr:hypothetical protein [Vibrio parahaemolyticus]
MSALDKYQPERHQQVHAIMTELVGQLTYQESEAFSVFMPLVSLSQLFAPGNTLEQGGVFVRQIAHCCRVMAAVKPDFYGSAWHQHCLAAMAQLGAVLGWYDTTLLRWQQFASGQSLQPTQE